MKVRLLFILTLMLILQACAVKPRAGDPAPVINADGSSGSYVPPARPAAADDATVTTRPATVTTDGGVELTPLTPPSAPQMAPAQNKAVAVLHNRARDQIANGDLSSAAVTLERALSIEPENAGSWHLLASLRETEKQYDMAEQMAARSNSFAASSESALQKANWELIARVRQQQGNSSGARAAKQQAGLLN